MRGRAQPSICQSKRPPRPAALAALPTAHRPAQRAPGQAQQQPVTRRSTVTYTVNPIRCGSPASWSITATRCCTRPSTTQPPITKQSARFSARSPGSLDRTRHRAAAGHDRLAGPSRTHRQAPCLPHPAHPPAKTAPPKSVPPHTLSAVTRSPATARASPRRPEPRPRGRNQSPSPFDPRGTRVPQPPSTPSPHAGHSIPPAASRDSTRTASASTGTIGASKHYSAAPRQPDTT